MLEFARSHLKEGHMYLMWKDTVFNYSYFLWFEDVSVSGHFQLITAGRQVVIVDVETVWYSV